MEKAKQIRRMFSLFSAYKMRRATCSYLPLRIWIEPTNFCNLKCILCPQNSDTSERGYMDLGLFTKIIDEVKGSVYDVNLCHRGESLFHPKIMEMIEYTNRSGIHTRLHTNATIMTEKVSRQLLETELDLISFSLDGYDKETYEKFRIGANFEVVLDNIITFLKLKKKMKRKKPYTIIQVIEPQEFSKSVEEREAFRHYFDHLAIDKVYVKRPHNWAGNVPGEGEVSSSRTYSPCTFCWYALTILWDGTVLICPQDYFVKTPLGNVSSSSLTEIWNGEEIKKLRRKMINGEVRKLDPCRHCDRLWRKTFLGVPVTNLKAFIGENIAGYNLVRKLIRR